MLKISACIVIYNENKATLKRVIEDFLCLDLEKELVIIDNSPHNDLEAFCKNYTAVKYIFTNKNLGFGRGHNLGFSNLSNKSDIHIIVNPDTYFNAPSIREFLYWFHSEKNISLVIPKILNPDNTIQNVVRNIPTPLNLIRRKLKLFNDELIVKNNSITDIPFAHGCFLVFKSDVYQKLNGFDEKFFMYMEDIDIFIRSKKYGRTVINTNYEIYHEYRKGSSKKLKLFYWHLLSAAKFFWKHYKKA